MPEKLAKDLYLLRVRLPRFKPPVLNAYLVAGDRSLLIDMGLYSLGALESLLAELGELGFRPADIDEVLATHSHIDHIGLAGIVAECRGAPVKMGAEECSILKEGGFQGYMDKVARVLAMQGIPEEVVRGMMASVGDEYPVPGVRRLYTEVLPRSVSCVLREGDTVEAGRYSFNVYVVSGHSPGHVVLHDPDHGVLVVGDHLLPKTTPQVSPLTPEDNPLARYLASLDKLERLDASLVLPGHEEVYRDHRARIRELRRHHEERLREMLKLLREGPRTALDIASRVKWNVDYASWDEMPPMDQYFALAETISHLNYLVAKGLVRWEDRSGARVYLLSGQRGTE